VRCPVLSRFSDAGMTRYPRAAAAGVRKAPMHEVAGSMAPGSAASAMVIVCWWRSRLVDAAPARGDVHCDMAGSM
jgi:hypothetical protein